MLKRLNDFLSGIPMTAAGGVFLILSLCASIAGIDMVFDPAWIAVIICGLPLLYLAVWRLCRNKGISRISSALLISIAMIAAIAIDDLFAAGEVAFIMAIGSILEQKTTERARSGIEQLMQLVPVCARRICGGSDEMVPVSDISVGDIIRILPGERIPVDGRIVAGVTSVDQSVMTGESLPADRCAGDEVFSGTMNLHGSIDVSACRVGKDSSLERLIKLVEDAESRKAPIQRIADRCASWLVPAALLLALASYLLTADIVRSVTVLVVFCPCALVLATPTAIMAAIGQAARNGVIIKSGEALEKMGSIDIAAFDKTGTLTYGRPVVSDVLILDPCWSRQHFISIVASAEKRSEHPLAKAFSEYASASGMEAAEASSFFMEAGKGIKADVHGHSVICGNRKLMEECGMSLDKAEADIMRLGNEGKALLIAACDGAAIGLIGFSDSIRGEAAGTIGKLSAIGLKCVVLTGDNERAASYMAAKLGDVDVYADLLPSQKVSMIDGMRAQGHKAAMVGDGVNDAPALKAADIGIAMGTAGSDIAVEAADIALVGDDISKLVYLKRLSDAAVRTIKLSIALSLCINAVAITLSLMGLLTPTIGALVHNAGSVLVVMIAALLYDRKF